jgi:hypothetical protein
MALAYEYADQYADSYEVDQDHHGLRIAREALRAALTEALKNKQDLYTSQERVQNSPESVHIVQPVQVPLTDEQIQEIYISEYNKGHHGRDFENLFARGIERAHHIGGDK